MQTVSSDVLVQIAAILVATGTFIVAQSFQRARDRKIARRDVYQKLEFASMDLFRFEADHLDLIRPVWEAGHPIPKKGTAEYTATMNYVCQLLNLFELALKFRQDKTMPADIFGSWVAWFYLLLRAPGFPGIWEDTRWNYLPQLRHLLDGGLKILNTEPDPQVQESRFYEYTSFLLQCAILQQWTAKETDHPFDAFWKSGLKSRKTKPLKDAKHITVQWVQDSTLADELANFFIQHTDTGYISHGELRAGRAIGLKTWHPDLASRLADEFKEALSHPPLQVSNVIGAFQHQTLIGYILLEYTLSGDGRYATLSDIVVDKKYRNTNIGHQLFEWADTRLRENDINIIYAESNIQNEVAHAFLRKQGFIPLSKVFIRKTEQ